MSHVKNCSILQRNSLSSTLAVIPYAEFMFSYATRKKLTTPFLNQKWVFKHFSAKKGQKAKKAKKAKKIFIPFLDVSGQNKAKKNFQKGGRKIFFPSLGKKNRFFFPRDGKMIFLPPF